MKFKKILGILVLLVFANTFLYAQSDNVKVICSDKKVMIKGKPYYIHIVKKGESVYAISKAYGVMQRDIAMENHEVFDGIQEGQSLKIPITLKKYQNRETDKYYYHTVKQGETIYYLTRKYDVKEKDIYKLNPKAKKGLQIGQVIKIAKPKKVKDKYPQEDDKYIYHKVAKKQTLYSLSKKYGLSQEVIIGANPEIEKIGLQFDMVVRIPKKQVPGIVEITDTVFIDTLSVDSLVSDSAINDCAVLDYSNNPVKYKVALMLPFIKDDIILSEEVDLKEIKQVREKTFLEFYEGVLLAIENLQNKGLDLELYIYDTERDTLAILEILKKNEMTTMDLIIGPVYSDLFPIVANFARKNKINIISPLSSNIELTKSNPFVFQVVPSFYTQLDEAIKFLGNSQKSNFIIVHNDTKEELDLIEIYKPKILNAFALNDSSSHVLIREISFKQKGIKGIVPLLLKDTGNVIIIPSSDQAFVSDVVTRIFIQYNKDYDITLIGFPVWTKFENISLEYFHKLQLNSFSSYYVDYDNDNVKEFVKQYRKIYLGEPGSYSFAGYDVTKYFLTALMNYGTDFPLCLDSLKIETLQSKFKFNKIDETGGYENTGAFIIRYDKEFNVNSITEEDLYVKEEEGVEQTIE